ncbi:MAG: hypothetical protein PVSMB4_00360 [Ktedonobacterales bacterium]
MDNGRDVFSRSADPDELHRQAISREALSDAVRRLAAGGTDAAGSLSPQALAELAQRAGLTGSARGGDLARLLGVDTGAGVTSDPPGSQYLVFSVGDVECALSTEAVQSVERLADVTPVPNTQPWVLGVVHLRGAIISVVDLRTFLGLPAAALTTRTRLLVASHHNMTMALTVDAVLEMRAGALGARPVEGQSAPDWIAPYASGVVELDGRRVTLIDAQRLLFSERIHQYRSDVS